MNADCGRSDSGTGSDNFCGVTSNGLSTNPDLRLLRPRDGDRGGRIIDRFGPDDVNGLAIDGDGSILEHRQRAFAGVEDDLLFGLNEYIPTAGGFASDTNREIAIDGGRLVGVVVLGDVLFDGIRRCVVGDGMFELAFRNGDRGVFIDSFCVSSIHGDRAIIVYGQRLVVFDGRCHVVLSVKGNHLLAFGVIERKFVVATTAQRAIGFDAGNHFLVGQFPGRHVVGVVSAADDDGLVGIAFEEIHKDFVADAWDLYPAPKFPGPNLCHSNPTRAVGVEFAFSVPVKLDLHATIFVGKDFFPVWPYDDGRLGSRYDWLGGCPLGAKRQRSRDASE